MDHRENTEFVNVGMDQPAEAEQGEDVIIKVDGPSGGKGWKIAAICALVAVVGLTGALVFSLMSMNDASRRIDAAEAEVDVLMEELREFRVATGVESPEDVVAAEKLNINFSEFSELLGENLIIAEGSVIKDVGDFRAAKFLMTSGKEQDSGYAAYLYKALPDGSWKYSGFSGNGIPECDDVTAEEIKIFADSGLWDGTLNCAE